MKRSLYMAGTCLLPGLAFGAAPQVAPAINDLVVAPHVTAALRDLAASASALPAAGQPVEMPRHRLPVFTAGRASVLPSLPTANVFPTTGTGTATGFTGIYEGANAAAIGGELEPPDQGLAANNGEILEVVNNSLQVFDSTGKALSQPVANATFFGDPTANLSDPHALYDASVQRWFVEELVFNNTFTGFYVAVSQTADPLGKYSVYKVSANTSTVSGCGSALCFPDYPQVGYDANGFFIGADLFSNGSGQFVNAAVYALPKATMVAGGTLKKYPDFIVPEFVVQPAVPAPKQAFESAQNGTEYLMTARNIFDNSTNVRVYAITNTANIVSNPSSLKASFADVSGESYTSSVPSTEPDVVGPYGKSVGATSAPLLDGGYNAFGGGVKYAGNSLFAALTTGSTDSKGLARDVIAWFNITPSVASGKVSASLTAQGYLVPPTGYSVSFPNFALGKNGHGYLGASITNPDMTKKGGFPSTFYVSFFGKKVSPTLHIVGQGATSDDGFTGYQSSAHVGRWGDYSVGTVDPTTGSFYTANEFIPDPTKFPRGHYANWGTFVTKIH